MCMQVCRYVYASRCICVCRYAYAGMCICVQVCVCKYVYRLRTPVCSYVYAGMCMQVCVEVYVITRAAQSASKSWVQPRGWPHDLEAYIYSSPSCERQLFLLRACACACAYVRNARSRTRAGLALILFCLS